MSNKLQIQVLSLHFHRTSTRTLRNMSCTYFFILATSSLCQNFQGNSKQTSVSCTYRIDLLTVLKRNPNKWCWLQKLSTQYPLLQWDEYDLAGNYVSSRSSKFNCTWLEALWQPITNSLTFDWTMNIICTAHYCISRWKNEWKHITILPRVWSSRWKQPWIVCQSCYTMLNTKSYERRNNHRQLLIVGELSYHWLLS